MNGKGNTMMENVYDGYEAVQVAEMLAQLSKPDANNEQGRELRNFNALPNNVYYITETSPMLQRGDPSTWVGSLRTSHRGDAKAFEFVSLVAKKFPRLTFCLRMGSSTGDNGEHYAWFSNLYVHAGGEAVGEMHTETEWGKPEVVMHFSNNRIHAARKHGGSMKTTKIDRGKSIVAKYFYGLTTIEAITYKAKVVIQQATSGQYQMQARRNHSKQRIIDFVRDQLTANDAAFIESMEHLVGNQQGSSPVALYKSCVDDLTLMDTVCKAQKQGEGLFVAINEAGEEYQTWKKDTTTVRKYVRHELPSKVLGALGMLKIAEDNSFISGTGYKYERGYYWITQEIANELGC